MKEIENGMKKIERRMDNKRKKINYGIAIKPPSFNHYLLRYVAFMFFISSEKKRAHDKRFRTINKAD